MDLTVLVDGREAAASFEEGRVVVAGDRLPEVLGWELKPEGLCRAEVCVPVRDRRAVDAGEGQVDLLGAAAALGRPTVLSVEDAVVAVGAPAGDRRSALRDRLAPAFTLPDLQGTPRSLGEWSGKKKLLVCWASW